MIDSRTLGQRQQNGHGPRRRQITELLRRQIRVLEIEQTGGRARIQRHQAGTEQFVLADHGASLGGLP
jgi:hypothetical protein